jgi:hypothetical protein
MRVKRNENKVADERRRGQKIGRMIAGELWGMGLVERGDNLDEKVA